MNCFSSKLDELQKYIDACETAKEKMNIRKAVRETKEERRKLENEEVDLDSRIRKINRDKVRRERK